MNAASKDVALMLEEESAMSLVFGTNLFLGQEPDKPNNCVTIFDTPSLPPQLTMDKAKYEYPSVQIRVRNVSYISAQGLAQDIMDQLHGRANETWGGSLYTVITCTGSPSLLDWDENNRVRFILNINLQRK